MWEKEPHVLTSFLRYDSEILHGRIHLSLRYESLSILAKRHPPPGTPSRGRSFRGNLLRSRPWSKSKPRLLLKKPPEFWNL